MKRVRYLQAALATSKSEKNREYAESVLLFSLFIEHVSLFSQFLIIMAFNKHKNMLKGVSNVVEATSKEEQIHGDFGIDLIKIINLDKNSNPINGKSRKINSIIKNKNLEKVSEFVRSLS